MRNEVKNIVMTIRLWYMLETGIDYPNPNRSNILTINVGDGARV